jgi:flagellar biosynthesis/type III secretory pathway ATPase
LQHVATRTVLPHGIRHVIGMLRQAQTQRIGPYASANTQLRTLLFQLVNL